MQIDNKLQEFSDATEMPSKINETEDRYLLTDPERRIFYVDVGSLPKAKVEQYLYEFMAARHKKQGHIQSR